MKHIHVCLAIVLCTLMPLVASESIWLEGEFPTKSGALKKAEGVPENNGYESADFKNPGVLSGDKVLSININGGQVDAYLPDNGLSFIYEFEIQSSGKKEIWARIGYEAVRSQFRWSIDSAEYQVCDRFTPTVNIQPIEDWREIAWIKLGTVELKKGKHSLDYNLFKHAAKNKKGK